MDVGKVPGGASHRWRNESQRNDSAEKFFYVDGGVLINIVEIQIEQTEGKWERPPE